MEMLIYFFAALAGIALVGFLYVQNKDIVVHKHRLDFAFLPKEFDEFKIVHLSDLHNRRFGKGQRRLIELVRKAKPDAIVITGDLIDKVLYRAAPALELIRGLHDTAPIYYVSGNHEWARPEYGAFKNKLIELGVHVLDNRVITIKRENALLAIAGIDDVARYQDELTDPECLNSFRPWGEKDAPVIRKIVHRELSVVRQQIDERAFKILLVHRPELLREYMEHYFNLILAGHAHGGQWNFPGLGPVVAPGQGVFPRLASGVHKRHSTYMVISRGIGNSGIWAFQRLFNKPEVLVVILKRIV